MKTKLTSSPPTTQAAGSARPHDVNLCDPCMDALRVDKERAWMGHCSDDGNVECDVCGAMEARLCFRLASGTRTNLPRVEWPAPNAASDACLQAAKKLDPQVDSATEQQHRSGQYGDWRHDAEVLRIAARILSPNPQ